MLVNRQFYSYNTYILVYLPGGNQGSVYRVGCETSSTETVTQKQKKYTCSECSANFKDNNLEEYYRQNHQMVSLFEVEPCFYGFMRCISLHTLSLKLYLDSYLLMTYSTQRTYSSFTAVSFLGMSLIGTISLAFYCAIFLKISNKSNVGSPLIQEGGSSIYYTLRVFGGRVENIFFLCDLLTGSSSFNYSWLIGETTAFLNQLSARHKELQKLGTDESQS